MRDAGGWSFEKHGTTKRRAWRKLHIGIDADSGEIVASDLTHKDVDDASHVEPLLDQLNAAPASFMVDGPYDRIAMHDVIIVRNFDALFIVPPCKEAVPGPTAETSPSQRDQHVLDINAHGRSNWQKATGYNRYAKVEAAISRYKRVIGYTLKSRDDASRVTEVAFTVESLRRSANLDKPTSSASRSRDRAGAGLRRQGSVRQDSARRLSSPAKSARS